MVSESGMDPLRHNGRVLVDALRRRGFSHALIRIIVAKRIRHASPPLVSPLHHRA